MGKKHRFDYFDAFKRLSELAVEESDLLIEIIEKMCIRDRAQIMGRPKHLYSIYQKMTKKGKGFSEIYDLIAVRVIVKSVKDCYSAVSYTHLDVYKRQASSGVRLMPLVLRSSPRFILVTTRMIALVGLSLIHI